MSTYKRFPRTHKKKPDEFVSLVDRLVRWVVPYRRVVLVLVGVGLVSCIVYFVHANQKQEGADQFNLQYFEALQGQDVVAKLAKVVEDNAGTSTIFLAHLSLLQEQLKTGDPARALTSVAAAKESSPPMFHAMLSLTEAQILWQMDKPDEALTILESLVLGQKTALALPDLIGLYPQFLKAQILLGKGQVALAQKFYEQIAEATADPFLQQKAREQLVIIKLAGPPLEPIKLTGQP